MIESFVDLEWHGVSKLWQNLNFGVNYPCKSATSLRQEVIRCAHKQESVKHQQTVRELKKYIIFQVNCWHVAKNQLMCLVSLLCDE